MKCQTLFSEKKIVLLPSAEFFTQHAKHLGKKIISLGSKILP